MRYRGGIKDFQIYLALAALCIFFAASSPLFASWQNFINILLSSTTLGVLTIGAALIIGSGGLDLSVGSVLAFSAAVASITLKHEAPWPLVIAACLITGLAVGCLNGSIIAFLNIPAFIVTLGTLSITRGAALIITDGLPIYGLPASIVFFGQGELFGIPVPIWIFLTTAAVLDLVLRHTAFGAHTLCIGDNRKAAFTAGIKVNRHILLLYMLSGLLAAVAGLIFMARINAADPNAGVAYELSAITGAILGGTNLFGGKTSVKGAVIGALVMGVLQNGLTLLAVPTYYQQLAIGAVLILAAALDRLNRGQN